MTIAEKLLSVVTSIANCLKNHDGRIGALEEGGGGSIDTGEFVKKTDYAGQSQHGVVQVEYTGGGLYVIGNGLLRVYGARPNNIDLKDSAHRPITTDVLDYAVKVGLTTNTETLTAEEQAAAQAWLGINLGDVKTALDSIIAIQESLIGGGLITFTVNGKEYQAEQGMTWLDLIDSEYNTATDYGPHVAFYESQEGEVYYFLNSVTDFVALDGLKVKATDVIKPNGAYTAVK